MDALIRLDELTKRYDRDAVPAVDGVSLQITADEAVEPIGALDSPTGELSGDRAEDAGHRGCAVRGSLPATGGRGAGLGAPPRVGVLVPTRNEAGNVGPLVARLGPVLAELGGEVLFVDDIDDHTPAAVAAAARATAVPVRLLHRARAQRTGGLGGAVQEGLAAGRTGRLVRFAMVGGSGVLVNLAALAVLLRVTPGVLGAGAAGQIIAAVAATQVAVGWNFALTERWVFPADPGTGWPGYCRFGCSIAARCWPSSRWPPGCRPCSAVPTCWPPGRP